MTTAREAAPFAATESRAFEHATVRKVYRRLIPFLCVLQVASYLDRINIGFAQLQMKSALGFSDSVYGLGAGIFFIGYFFFEVPSNLILSRIGARVWIARIMITWGLISSAMAIVRTPAGFYALRFLLGVAEAGFFPGVIYYLTLWFPAEYRGRIFGLFLIISPLNNTIAAPLGGLILKYSNGLMGLPGWRWLFIVEGLPTLLMAYLCLRVVVDRPEKATWLTDAEKAHLHAKLQREAESRVETKHLSIWQTLGHPKVLLFAVVYTSLAIGIYGLSLWMPQLIKGMGVTDSFHIGL